MKNFLFFLFFLTFGCSIEDNKIKFGIKESRFKAREMVTQAGQAERLEPQSRIITNTSLLSENDSNDNSYSFEHREPLSPSTPTAPAIPETPVLPSAQAPSKKENYILTEKTLKGNESLTIENKNIILKGNLSVKDNATLIIKNSTIEVQQDFSQQYRLEIRNNAVFKVHNTEFINGDTWMNWGYYDNAQIEQLNFLHTQNPWQEAHGSSQLNFTNSAVSVTMMNSAQNAKLTATNAPFVQIELIFKEYSNYSFDHLPNGQKNKDFYFEIPGSYVLDIKNSNFFGVDINLGVGNHITVKNTKELKFGWIFGLNEDHYKGKSDSISGLKKKHYTKTSFYAGSGNSASSLTLINTSVENWWPTVWTNHTLYLNDCTLADPRVSQDAKLFVSNSTSMMFGASGNSQLNVSHSTVDDFVVFKDNAQVQFNSVQFNGDRSVAPGVQFTEN